MDPFVSIVSGPNCLDRRQVRCLVVKTFVRFVIVFSSLIVVREVVIIAQGKVEV